MKKFLCVLLSLVMLLSLAACGGNNGGAAADATANDGDASNDPAVTLAAAFAKPLLKHARRAAASEACRRIAKRIQGLFVPVEL